MKDARAGKFLRASVGASAEHSQPWRSYAGAGRRHERWLN